MMKTRIHGFSLVELIIVISIIALLVGIIGPSISKIRELSFRAKSTAAIQELSSGAMQYKSEYNYYPLQNGIPDSGTYGNKVSAAFGKLMLGYITVSSGTDTTFKSGTYERKPLIPESNDRFALTSSFEFKKENGSTISEQYTPLDQWKKGDEMAVLYYPSNTGNDGGLTSTNPAFNRTCNNFYTTGSLPSINSTKFKIVDEKFGPSDSKAFNSDSFLLIAPGIDREYFTEDDVKNF